MSYLAAVLLTIVLFIVLPSKGIVKDNEDPETGEINCSECGVGESTEDHRIINGAPVKNSQKYPWMVSLRIQQTPNSEKDHQCGGAIISESFILSAGHCFEGVKEDDVEVMLMTESTDHFSEGKAVGEIIRHEKFDFPLYDVGLLKLKEPIKCTPYSRPICLPQPDFKAQRDDEFITSGWGFTQSQADRPSEVLKEAHIKSDRMENCQQYLNPSLSIPKGHTLCLKGEQDSSTCFGDSGGPMFKLYDGKYHVIGTTSGGSPKCDKNASFFFMSIPFVTDWIQEKTGLSPTNNTFNDPERDRK